MHLLSLVLFALFVGTSFSLFMREGLGDRVRFALGLAATMVALAIAGGWLMILIG